MRKLIAILAVLMLIIFDLSTNLIGSSKIYAESGIQEIVKTTEKSAEREQVLKIEHPEAHKVYDIKVNTGSVEVIERKEDEVKIKLFNGDAVGEIQTGGEYLPEDTKEVVFTLSFLQERRRINNNNYEVDISTLNTDSNYKGNLSREYIGFDSKIVSFKNAICKERVTKYFVYDNGDWLEEKPPSQACIKDLLVYEDGFGFGSVYNLIDGESFGDLFWNYEEVPLNQDDYIIEDEREDITNPEQGQGAYKKIYTHIVKAEGYAFKNYLQEAKWKYSGTVHRPEIDTREYEDVYRYEVTLSIDNLPPNIELKNVPEVHLKEDGEATVKVDISDEGSGLDSNNTTCTIRNTSTNGEPVGCESMNKIDDYNLEYEIEIPKDPGVYEIEIVAIDNVGNKTTKTKTITRNGTLEMSIAEGLGFEDITLNGTGEQTSMASTKISVIDTRIDSGWTLSMEYDGFKDSDKDIVFPGELNLSVGGNESYTVDTNKPLSISDGDVDAELDLVFTLDVPRTTKVGNYESTVTFTLVSGQPSG